MSDLQHRLLFPRNTRDVEAKQPFVFFVKNSLLNLVNLFCGIFGITDPDIEDCTVFRGPLKILVHFVLSLRSPNRSRLG